MSIEAAAQRMNDLGWTCTAHEPFHFGDCKVCHPIQVDAATEMIAAYAGNRALYEAVLCPSSRGVMHDGCDYLSHVICNKCGWIEKDHDGCLRGMVFVQVWPEVSK